MIVAQQIFDKLAIILSALCFLHCTLVPVVMLTMPLVWLGSLQGEHIHQLLIIGVLPFSLFALLLGCRKHRTWSILRLGSFGLVLLVLAALIGHDFLGEIGEKLVTMIGSTLLIIGHIRNFKLCKLQDC